MIPGDLILLQPYFWFSLSLLSLGSILGSYPAYQLDRMLRKAKKKQRVAYKALAQVQDVQNLENQESKSLQKSKTKLAIQASDSFVRTSSKKLVTLRNNIGSILRFKYPWQVTGLFRMFMFVISVFVGLYVFQVQRQVHSLYGIPFLRTNLTQSGGELLVEWIREIASFPHATNYWATLILLGFVWSMFRLWVRWFFLSIYILTLVLVIQSLGSFPQGDPLRVEYVGVTPATAVVIISLNQSLLELEEPIEFGRVLFEGFQFPHWTICLGIPPILVRSFRIDFGEPGLVARESIMSDQNQSNGPREFVLNEASQPRPLVGTVSNLGLDVIELVNSFSFSIPFARRSGFLSPFDDPEGVVIFDRGLFTLVLSPGIR